MGTWGTGNLESDGAQDTLADICDQLWARIIELFNHPRSHEYDDEEIDELFVRIEMIFALSDRGMITSSPDVAELRQHFAPYLKKWTDYQNGSGNDPWPERCKVIEDTFNRLAQIAEGSADGNFSHRLDLISGAMSDDTSEEDTH